MCMRENFNTYKWDIQFRIQTETFIDKRSYGFVVLGIYVALAVFQPYRDLEAGDNQSLKFNWQDRESNRKPIA